VLPFQALPFDGEPLTATRAISYLPSASTLQFLHTGQRHPLPDHILAIGNPTGDLPAAAVEANFVARLFGQSALVGDTATKEAVRQRIAGSRLLHFATHGDLSEEAPLNSSISLAHGENISVYELMGLRLKADLVVLSACNTGQGTTTGGDDVLGLTRALFAAGARAAVVSLWPVDDLSTSLLMGEFYRRLRSGVLPDAALQQAQNCLRGLSQEAVVSALADLKNALNGLAQAGPVDAALNTSLAFRHLRPAGMPPSQSNYDLPFYWAPFILVGGVE
jgi:CHAT domain-containing protein